MEAKTWRDWRNISYKKLLTEEPNLENKILHIYLIAFYIDHFQLSSFSSRKGKFQY